jgi:hypothetical protein
MAGFPKERHPERSDRQGAESKDLCFVDAKWISYGILQKPQILRLRLPQETRQTTLRMTPRLQYQSLWQNYVWIRANAKPL